MSITKTPCKVNLTAIPRMMFEVRQWVVWKYQNRRGTYCKIPFNPLTGRSAKSNAPSTWVSIEEAVRAYETSQYSGIGFMFAAGFAGIDLDHCRNRYTGKVEAWAMEIVNELESYTEVSPLECGLHIFVKAKLSGSGIKRNMNGHKIEIYDTARFFTFTGAHIEGTPLDVCERQVQVESLYNDVIQNNDKGGTTLASSNEVALSDNDVMELALNARNGSKFEGLWYGNTKEYSSHSEADLAFVRNLCFWTPDNEQVARLWKSSKLYRAKITRDDYEERTIAKARSLQTESYKPSARSKEIVNSYSEVSPSEDENEGDDPPISEDTNREKYLRQVLANSSRMTRARMMMASALEFEKLPWRLLNAIHAHQRNRLGVKIITDEKLAELYQANGERSASERTIRRDKEKLWKQQRRIGVELFWYWHGRQNPQTGVNYGSKYVSNLDRWALMAIDRAITTNSNNYSIRDDQLRAACDEIALSIVRQPEMNGKGNKEADMIKEIVKVEKQLYQVGKQYKKLLQELRGKLADAGYTGGEIYKKLEQVERELKMSAY